ncbi:MAG: tetratricopeptide repeat protein [Anaerolineae bacterium]
MAWAAAERLNLLAAQEVAREQGRREEAIELAYTLDDLFERAGHWDLRRQALEMGRDVAQAFSLRDHAALTHNLGVLAQAQRDYPEARRLYEQAAEVFRELGALREQAAVLHQLGMLAQDQGDYPEARRLYEESLRIAEQLGDRAGVAITTAQMALLEEAEGNLPRALELVTRAENIFTQLGSPYREQARRDRERIQRALHQ